MPIHSCDLVTSAKVRESAAASDLTSWPALSVRAALAAGFLSAVADRFGLWGPTGAPGVSWGGFASFLTYTGKLLWFLPAGFVPAAGWMATAAEIVLAVSLLVGLQLRWVALISGLLLTTFALTMTFALGPERPLSSSVWLGAAAAFLLASLQPNVSDRN
jgi:uncharacterized membrane protein YphA (DoxX/SURF4 family)